MWYRGGDKGQGRGSYKEQKTQRKSSRIRKVWVIEILQKNIPEAEIENWELGLNLGFVASC